MEFIKSGEAILMAAAGCLGWLYPTWDGFLAKMKDYALKMNPAFTADEHDFLSFVDEIKECLARDKYYSLIYNLHTPKNYCTYEQI